MRRICEYCKDRETCSYIKNKKESDCIDVQTSDYGYEEAVDKACEWWTEYLDYPTYIEEDRVRIKEMVNDFRKAMEE